MSSISVAISSPVPQVILSTWSQSSAEAVFAACGVLESAFYASLKAGETQVGRVVKWIRETSIEQIHQIQAIFNAINVAAIYFCVKKLVSELKEKRVYQVFTVASSLTWKIIPAGLLAGGFALGSATFISAFFVRRFLLNSDQAEVRSEVTIKEKDSFQQKIAKYLHVTKLVLNVALAIFAKNPFWVIIGLFGTGYSFLKNVKIKWLSFSRNFPNHVIMNLDVPIRGATACYNMLALPTETSSREDQCMICLDPQPDTAFCTDHVFHRTCVAEYVVQRSNTLLQNAFFLKRSTRHYYNGSYTGTSHSYKVTIPQNNLPSCPNCRDFPLQNGCEIEVMDAYHGNFNANVEIAGQKDLQPLFETLYSVYNIGQAGLTYLQRYPELAEMIFKVQKVLMIADIAGLALTLYYLCKSVRRKLNITSEDSWKFNLAASVVVVASLALSYVVLGQLRLYLKSSIVLKELLEKLPISADLLKNMEIDWASPTAFKWMQFFHLNRMVSIFALSFFSKKRITNLLSAAAQLFSLAGISQLRWIELTQTLAYPLPKVVQSGGTLATSLTSQSLASLKVTSQFFVNNPCIKEPHHLQSTIQSIYKYISQMLDKSSWRRYWNVQYYNGVEVGRSLEYGVTLQNIPLQACDCTLTPSLSSVAMNGVDSYYGKASVFASFAKSAS